MTSDAFRDDFTTCNYDVGQSSLPAQLTVLYTQFVERDTRSYTLSFVTLCASCLRLNANVSF